MWRIEIATYGRLDSYCFDNGDDAEAFRKAAEKIKSEVEGRPVEVTLWYRGRKYRRLDANDIAHYYQRYTQSYVLYAPDCTAIYESHSVKELFQWAQARGIGTVVKGEYEARHLNRGD